MEDQYEVVTEQHAGFQGRHDRSERALLVAGLWLHRQGSTVLIPGKHQAPTAKVCMDYIDNGDLWILQGEAELLVEVHGYNIDFTTRWPFKDVILKSVGPLDRLGFDKVDRFIICNRNYTHAALVYARAEEPRFRVWKRWIKPSNTNKWEHKYVCSPADAVLVRLRDTDTPETADCRPTGPSWKTGNER